MAAPPMPPDAGCHCTAKSSPRLPLWHCQAHDALWPAITACLQPLLSQDGGGARRRALEATRAAALPFPTLSEATSLVQQYGSKLLQLQALSAQQAFTNSVEVRRAEGSGWHAGRQACPAPATRKASGMTLPRLASMPTLLPHRWLRRACWAWQ